MTFDLQTAKKRLGIDPGDIDSDQEILAILAATMRTAENYTDRRFERANDVDEFFEETGRVLSLKRYPVETVDLIASDSLQLLDPATYRVSRGNGLIYLNGWSWAFGRRVEVVYTGGYAEIPPDVEIALWAIFDLIWEANAATTGQTVPTDDLAPAGALVGITIPDVGTLRFDGKTGGFGAGVGAASALDPWAAYRPAINLLDPYKRIQA